MTQYKGNMSSRSSRFSVILKVMLQNYRKSWRNVSSELYLCWIVWDSAVQWCSGQIKIINRTLVWWKTSFTRNMFEKKCENYICDHSFKAFIFYRIMQLFLTYKLLLIIMRKHVFIISSNSEEFASDEYRRNIKLYWISL